MDDLAILLPGLGLGPEPFDALAAILRDAGFQVVGYDPRPTLEAVAPEPGVSLHDLAADVVAVIEARQPRAHLVGWAFGNRVARCAAADRPDVVRSVTLLAAGGLVPPDPDVHAAMRSADPAERNRVLFAPGNEPLDLGVWFSAATAKVQSAAVAATPLEDWWLGGTAPMLVIQGLDDRVAVPANGRRLVAEIGDRGRLVEIANAGHALVVEQPQAIAQQLLPFLRGGLRLGGRNGKAWVRRSASGQSGSVSRTSCCCRGSERSRR